MKLTVNTVDIFPGEETTIEINVAKLPTRTEIKIPVTIYNSNNEGPTLLLMAGMHGDEINGIEILRRVLDDKIHRVENGRVIVVPMLNVYGFLNFSRAVPDGKDVNRSFPGSVNGSLASKVAYMLMSQVIPQIDFGIDFHTGGGQINNHPQVRADFSHPNNHSLADLFQAPFKIHSRFIPKSLRWAAHKRGKQILVYEGGESLRFSTEAIQEGLDGIKRVLKGLEMISEAPKQHKKIVELGSRKWLRALDSGLWIINCKQGDYIEKGQVLGYTTSPFGDSKTNIIAPENGYIIGLNYMSVVNTGDALIHIGKEI